MWLFQPSPALPPLINLLYIVPVMGMEHILLNVMMLKAFLVPVVVPVLNDFMEEEKWWANTYSGLLETGVFAEWRMVWFCSRRWQCSAFRQLLQGAG